MTRPIHPLTGADLGTLIRLWAQNGSPSRPLEYVAALGSALGRLPSTAIERAYVATQHEARSNMPAPVFILGHWRSGTTHLFNLLASSRQFAYTMPISTGMPWDFLLLGRLLAPLLERSIPSERYIDAMEVTPTSPQEDEIALAATTAPSYYHGVYFPRHLRRHFDAGLFFDGCSPHEIVRWQKGLKLFTEKIYLEQSQQPVLIKNPGHTAKIPQILEIWPEAKFVHLVRNPYYVYRSTERMMQRLLEMVALQPWDTSELEQTILETYPRMMKAIAADAQSLSPGQFVEVRYEALTEDPIGQLRRIVDTLALGDGDRRLQAARDHLKAVASYRRSPKAMSASAIETVDARWREQVEYWGYDRPQQVA